MSTSESGVIDGAVKLPEYPDTVAVSEVEPLADEVIPFDVETIRGDFPILERTSGDGPLVYLDSANTSQKPRVVVEAIEDHYLNHNANVARAM
ncbi:MAG: aminotransferase class V-fold PLP-dependent enzyme, partial [Propionibacteriaceae bacterium]